MINTHPAGAIGLNFIGPSMAVGSPNKSPTGGGVEKKPLKRQEISSVLKYLVFSANFVFFVCGIVCLALGIYLLSSDFRPVLEAVDFLVNPYLLLIVSGCLIFFVSFLGCTGALRENVCILKCFGLSLFLIYICLVILAFVVFILFYSNTDTGVSIQSVLLSAVRRYRDNKNMELLMDVLQIQLDCCGATVSQGYKDWDQSPMFNCSALESPEHCGVPYSCCKQLYRKQSNCGFGAQRKSITELNEQLNTEGCVSKLHKAFEGYAVIVGAVIGAIIIPVCISITLANILANQVDRQRYILQRQSKREEKWRRRMRQKFRDPLAVSSGQLSSVERVAEISGSFEDRLPTAKSSSNPPVNQSAVGCSRLGRHSSESDVEAAVESKHPRRGRKPREKDQLRSVSVDQVERSRRKRPRAGDLPKENNRDQSRKRRGSHDVLGSQSHLKPAGQSRPQHRDKRDGSGGKIVDEEVRLRHGNKDRKRQKQRNSREFILSDDWLKTVGSGADMSGPITSSTNLIDEFAAQQQSSLADTNSPATTGDYLSRDSVNNVTSSPNQM